MKQNPEPLREWHVSHAECLARCEREYELRHVFGVEQPDRPHLATGSGIHRGVAALRQGLGVSASWAAALAPGEDREALPALRMLAMLRGYDEYWGVPGRWNGPPLAGAADELHLRAPLINPGTRAKSRTFRLVGTLDALLPGWSIYELKTTRDTVEETARYLREGIQLPVYGELHALTQCAEPLSYVIDVIKKPVAKSRKGEPSVDYAKRMLEDYRRRPEHFFYRAEVAYSPSHRRWAMELMWRLAGRAREVIRHGGLAVHGWSCCKRGDGWCGYKSLCWYDEIDSFPSPMGAAV